MENGVKTIKQQVKITDRKSVEMDGVESVVAFDEDSVAILTSAGRMIIEGDELKIIDLSQGTGKITIVGNITALWYQDGKEKRKKGFFG